MNIDSALVQKLIDAQFPEWQNLPIRPVERSGWDNRTFHLGNDLLVRLPSAAQYAAQVEKEQYWLPKLAPHLPLQIPTPVAIGRPTEYYPLKWSIYKWIQGESLASGQVMDLCDIARALAKFLTPLHSTSTTNGPHAGEHNFHRGGNLAVYDAETRRAIAMLHGKIDTHAALTLWENALATKWQHPPVWVHGDISAGNLLVKEGKLVAVIDFGQLAVGDPACDLGIAWTVFEGQSREAFRAMLPLDKDTWSRARAWVLWKALIVAAGFANPNNAEAKKCWRIIDEVLKD